MEEKALVDSIISIAAKTTNKCPFCSRSHDRECKKHRDFIANSELYSRSLKLQKVPCSSEIPVNCPKSVPFIQTINENYFKAPRTSHRSQSSISKTSSVAGILYEPKELNTNLNYIKNKKRIEDLMFPSDSNSSVEERRATLESTFVDRTPTENKSTKQLEAESPDARAPVFIPPVYDLSTLKLDDDLSWFILNHANEVLGNDEQHLFEGHSLLALSEILKGLQQCEFSVKEAAVHLESKSFNFSEKSLSESISSSIPLLSIKYSDLIRNKK
eukprot:NODE_325_length_10950_cov_0.271864.p5 type:complete len:272 gc:universal NODE_325_length_10950_cov_0.271864:7792-8607(+)